MLNKGNHEILIALGANLGVRACQPRDTLIMAIAALSNIFSIKAQSRFYASPAWPDASDPPFVNAVISAHTAHSPQQTLELLHITEAAFGRRRDKRNAPRTLDLDLLDWAGLIVPGDGAKKTAAPISGENALILPHLALGERDFVLAPLCDIRPEWRHPQTGLTARQMLDALPVQTAKVMAEPSQG